jgi:V/A-type H+-transporting ATPase subunit I
VENFDYLGLLKELSLLRNDLKTLYQHKERLTQERHLFSPWHNLNLPLDQIHSTQNCGILLGVLSSRDYANLSEDYQKENINLFCEVIQQDNANTYLAMIYLKEEFERLEGVLKNHHFNFITLSRHQGKVKDRLLEINRQVLVLDDQIQDAKEKIAKLSKESFKLMLFYDYLSNIRKIQEADKNLVGQQYTFNLSGWIREKDVKLLEKKFSARFKDLALFISEPGLETDIPVILENKPLIQPFEFITKIYGMPKYNELDPTPYLAPFFFLYFGLCVSDVGYGLILAFLFWFLPKKLKAGPQGQKIARLGLYCAISTVIIGALTGSWFGNSLDLLSEAHKIFLPLKDFKDSLVLLDPLKEPTKLLGIALSFGIIQVWFGNIVAAIGNIKNKRYLDILQDQVPIFMLLFGLTGLGLIFLKLIDNARLNLFKYAAILGGIALIATQGRSEKGVGAKLFYGIYNLYNALSGYLSDILSYSRLWALGLVTGVMASTINLIAVQFSQILPSVIPFINKLIFVKIVISGFILIIIFVSGHAVSLLMNLLGAFVHPLRLQFVEFFSKFFKSGGSSFKPFKVETKYINIG